MCSSILFFFWFWFIATANTLEHFFFFFFGQISKTNSRFQSAADAPIAFIGAGCRARSTKPIHHWQVVGTRFVQVGGQSLHPEATGLPIEGKFCILLLVKCVSSLLFFRAIGYLVWLRRHSGVGGGGGEIYKVARRDTGAYVYKRLVS